MEDGDGLADTDGRLNGDLPLHLLESAQQGMEKEAAETARIEGEQRKFIRTLSDVLVARLMELPKDEFKKTVPELKELRSINVIRAVAKAGTDRVKAEREETRQRIEKNRNRERHTLNYMRQYRR